MALEEATLNEINLNQDTERKEELRAENKQIEKQLRKYERELWAINGMKEHNFEFKCVLTVYNIYEKLDLVPTHYNYPEFYRF